MAVIFTTLIGPSVADVAAEWCFRCTIDLKIETNLTKNDPLNEETQALPDQQQRLAVLLSDLTDRNLRGEYVSLDEICKSNPDLEVELRKLWATVMVTQVAGDRRDEADANEPPPASFKLPCDFGDYRLEEEIGRGGMGIVYRARQLSLDREVALKMILKGQFANEEERRRFRTEAEAAAKITHPNIVSIAEVGEFEGHDYFCMEFIRGGTLADRLNKGPLPPREAAKIVADIARAIALAHDNSIVHRDLKPSNILIGTSGTPYVADFGLAKKHTHSLQISKSNSVVGTPAYMAPEQVARARGDAAPSSDVYSLGAMLYHMLTGRPPFQAASPVELMMMVLDEDPVPVRTLNRNVDRDLEMIVMRCLQKPQDLRYQSAETLSGDLTAYLKGEAISARDGRLAHIIANVFRETHHASVLENWGLLWMWHSLVLLIACFTTNFLLWQGFQSRWSYWFIWSLGFGTWAVVFWWLRRRIGPVTFVERQIAHTWAGSTLAVIVMFPLEFVLDLPVLTLSPLLALVGALTFVVKAGILGGQFYIHATVLLATAFLMAWFPEFGLIIFGLTASSCFFFTGLKYHLQRAGNDDERLAENRRT